MSIDYTGQKKNKLTALQPDPERKGYWIFRCDCGTEKSIRARNVFSGGTKSCGCARRKNDLTGQRYGLLTVLYDTGKTERTGHVWLCQCDCGNTIEVSAGRLNHGKVKSCGCLPHERKDITGKRYGRLVAIKELDKKVGTTHLWECQCDCGKIISASLATLEAGNKNSCGCLYRENLRNMYAGGTNTAKFFAEKKLRSTNTSGVTGVYWRKDKQKWAAEIIFRKKRYRLGYFETLEEAAAARKKAEDQLHEDFEAWCSENIKKENK